MCTREVMMIKNSEYLKHVRALISNGWCQGSYALSFEGTICDPDRSVAAKFCLVGASVRAKTDLIIDHVDPNAPSISRLLKPILPDVFSIAKWNDTPGRTHEEVLEVLNQAIIHWQEVETRREQEVADRRAYHKQYDRKRREFA